MALPLPQFTVDGVLPPGDYPLTFEELCTSMLVVGPADCPNWDSHWRAKLVNNMEVMVKQLWQAGIDRIFINGSFVEDKNHPNDIDGYFECDRAMFASGELERKLNLIDPHKVWTWSKSSRRSYHGYPKKQLSMWHQYRVEFYPHWGQLCGILDRHGHELQFPSAFRKNRCDDAPKGIIQIVR